MIGTAHKPLDGRPRSVIGEVFLTPGGVNTVLRVGSEFSDKAGGWIQTEHVILTPTEVDALIAALRVARGKEA
jgi:hypothetical protein